MLLWMGIISSKLLFDLVYQVVIKGSTSVLFPLKPTFCPIGTVSVDGLCFLSQTGATTKFSRLSSMVTSNHM